MNSPSLLALGHARLVEVAGPWDIFFVLTDLSAQEVPVPSVVEQD